MELYIGYFSHLSNQIPDKEAIEEQKDSFWLKVWRAPVCYEWKGMVAGSCVATKAQTKTTQILSHLSGTWSRRTQEVGHGYRPQDQPAVIHLLQLYPTSSNHTLNWGPSVQIHGPVGDILHTDQGSLSFVIWWLITMVSLMRFRRVHLWGII